MNAETKQCPLCGETILAVAKKCKHCQSDISSMPMASVTSTTVASAPTGSKADYGIALLAIPMVGVLLLWFWVGYMTLLQGPWSSLELVAVATIGLTAVIAAMEASKLGTVTDRNAGTYSPIQWLCIIALLWIVGYPAYLLKRRRYGLKNYFVGGLILALVFLGSLVAMRYSIEERQDEVQAEVQKNQQQLDKAAQDFQSAADKLSGNDPDANKQAEDVLKQIVAAAQSEQTNQSTSGVSTPVQPTASAPESEQIPVARAEPSFVEQIYAGPSFDCRKASMTVEKMICADPKLAKADADLAAFYRSNLAASGDGQASLKQSQRVFLLQRNQCVTSECIEESYRARWEEIAQLGYVRQ